MPKGVYKRISTDERFWSKVFIFDEADPDSCWIWSGGTTHRGYAQEYGKFWHDDYTDLAHRYAYESVFGLVSCEIVMHDCDNTLCVRPMHLTEGTQDDNMQDAARKNHKGRSLSEDIVRKMRAEYAAGGVTFVYLAAKYDSTPQSVRSAVVGESWSHLGC